MEELDDLTPILAVENALAILLGAALGTLFAVLVAPYWLPSLTASLTGPNPKVYWYLARGSGIVAYLLLWLSVVLGLMVSNKMARTWPGAPAAVDLHQFTSLLALIFVLFHMLILLGDRYINYTLLQLLVPFASTEYRPLWVGLGQVAFYLTALVTFSFYVRRRIGHRAWRFLHYASFAVYLLVTAHGLGAGTDSRAPVVVVLYGLTGLVTYFLTVYRILVSVRQPRRSTQVPSRGSKPGITTQISRPSSNGREPARARGGVQDANPLPPQPSLLSGSGGRTSWQGEEVKSLNDLPGN